MNLRIIGTSHIARQSIEEIKKAIEDDTPDIVAVELDRERAAALMQKQQRRISFREIAQIGLRGYLFVRIGQYLQQKLGKMVGVAPGSEMKAAIELARKKNLELALIDQPITTTLRHFSKNLTWTEKGRFVLDMVKGVFLPKKQIKELGLDNFDLHKVPADEMIQKMMAPLKRRYPSVYKTLVEDRNKYMVKQLIKLMREKPGKKILAVVGAGHKEGMEKLLLKVEIVR
ncbi:MAG: TraB/GumN family protein [Nanoarchaeota archaeon]|nr:TraB/GumN family protein [Nanoarchaeota archaeon]